MCGQVIYPAAVMNMSANGDAARAFLDFLHSETASAVFESVGFTPIL
jgi:molybdate transport system substrate-binding protein